MEDHDLMEIVNAWRLVKKVLYIQTHAVGSTRGTQRRVCVNLHLPNDDNTAMEDEGMLNDPSLRLQKQYYEKDPLSIIVDLEGTGRMSVISRPPACIVCGKEGHGLNGCHYYTLLGTDCLDYGLRGDQPGGPWGGHGNMPDSEDEVEVKPGRKARRKSSGAAPKQPKKPATPEPPVVPKKTMPESSRKRARAPSEAVPGPSTPAMPKGVKRSPKKPKQAKKTIEVSEDEPETVEGKGKSKRKTTSVVVEDDTSNNDKVDDDAND
jgi:hypothetical protein